MRSLRRATVAALFGTMLLLPAATEAQDAATAGIPHVLPRPVMPTLKPAASSLQRAGTLNITINVPITSNIPPSQTIFCEVQLGAIDASFFNFVSVSGKVTRSGKSGTCRFSIPYIFQVVNTATPLALVAAVFTANAALTIEYESEFAEAFAPVPTGTTNLTITLGI